MDITRRSMLVWCCCATGVIPSAGWQSGQPNSTIPIRLQGLDPKLSQNTPLPLSALSVRHGPNLGRGTGPVGLAMGAISSGATLPHTA